MLVAGFDTETTGISMQDDWIVEVAVVLWDTQAQAPFRKNKLDFCSKIKGDHIQGLSEEVSAIHGISLDDLLTYGSSPAFVFGTLNSILAKADAICAHNGNLFDRPMYEGNCARLGIEKVDKLWIDTTCDIEYPESIITRKLSYLATEHGFMNPFPHAALSDVLTMLKVADCYDWDKTLVYAKAPTLVIRADVSYQQRELAKKQGFKWNPDQRIWLKSIKDFQFESERHKAREAGFQLTVLKGPEDGKTS